MTNSGSRPTSRFFSLRHLVKKGVSAKRIWGAAFVVVIAFGAVARSAWLRADPPVLGLGIVWHDEGAWTHSARNKALFGQWRTDEWNPAFVTPIFTGAVYLSFKAFGVGLWQARFTSVAAGVLMLVLTIVGLRVVTGRAEVALMGGTLLASNFCLIMWSRVALIEGTMAMFVVAAWAASAISLKRPRVGASSGLMAGLAYFTKASSAAFVAAIVFESFIGFLTTRHWRSRSVSNRDLIRPILWTLAGLAASSLLIALIFVIPYWREYYFYNVSMSVVRKPDYDVHAVLMRASLLPFSTSFYSQIWPVTLAAGLMVMQTLTRWRSAPSPHRLAVWWLLFGMAQLVLHNSTEGRYHVMLVPAVIILGVLFWHNQRDEWNWSEAPLIQRLALAPVFLWLAYWMVGSLVRWPFAGAISVGHYQGAVRVSAAVAIVIVLIWIAAIFPRRANWLSPGAFRTGLAVLFSATSLWNMVSFFEWADSRTYLNYQASVDIGRELGEAAVQGKLANGLALENRIRPIFIGNGFGNFADRFQRADARYVLTYELPWEGYESGARRARLITDLLNAYPSVGPESGRLPIAEWRLQDLPEGPGRIVLFDKQLQATDLRRTSPGPLRR